MARTRVKICGITRREDARRAVALGADALGFVFVAASARCVSLETARRMVRELPPFVTPVGLFLDAETEEVEAALEAMPDLVPQFHGRESASWCEAFGRPYLKALGVAEGLPTRRALEAYEGARGFLLDSHAPGALGGTGHAFDWRRLADGALEADDEDGRARVGGRALILAGGLDASNAEEAVATLRPYALDVSSGVERAKGVKDEEAMRAFLDAVRRADTNTTETTT